MKGPFFSLRLVLSSAVLLPLGFTASAVTFSTDTAISLNNTNYDGLDIAVTNCTLTVDGPHAFASLQVLSGGNLTHTFVPAGVLYDSRAVTNEPQVLSVTNAATLSNAIVNVPTLVVRDFTGVMTYTNGADYVVGSDTSGMTTLLLTTNSTIAEGSTNLVSYQYSIAVAAGLNLTVTGGVTVAQGGMINADAKGYSGGQGPGHGNSSGSPASGSGAGYGGSGGATSMSAGGACYDSFQQPTGLGSGGGSGSAGVGGAGGGSIKLIVGGTMRVDGTVTANGGAGEPSLGGGGGGGRISLQYNANSFPGTIAARGGNGYVRGGAGTIYTQGNAPATGQLLADNGGRTGAATALSTAQTVDLTVQGGATIALLNSAIVGNLFVASNAWITTADQPLTVTNNATIQAGGGISADGSGNAGGSGTGAGRSVSSSIGYVGGGAGYGGYGAAGGTPANYSAYGGSTYGSVLSPVDLGSGGGSYSPYAIGGPGGGAVRVNVAGMLLLDGRISADGSPGLTDGGGGGSGGSVWLTVGALAGAGTISANGGTGYGVGLGGGGGGGGGRIAVQYAANLFFGVTSARGGGGYAYGGAGTIYSQANSQSWGQVLADNGGQAGTNTTWSLTSTIDLTVKGGAVVTPPSSQPMGTLLVASNGWLSLGSQVLTVSGNATVQSGGGIIADRTGYAGGAGSGAGGYYSSNYGYIGGGGGYGGYGGSGPTGSTTYYVAPGGNSYGSVTAPTDLGSGGGGYSSAIGGAGGGAIRLTVTGVLQVDGRISAAGGTAVSASGGGGAGGTISLTVGTLTGAGAIAANGGMGSGQGGGGGGGRIAILYGVYDFFGAVTAYGGSGYIAGGAGTVYTKASSQSSGLVVADNGGQAGTNTTLSGSTVSALDVTVRGGAIVSPWGSSYWPAIGNLLVASNGWLVPNNPGYAASITITGNATVQAGGGITADGTGYPSGSGPGPGRYYNSSYYGFVGGGGGYGGYGAAGATGVDNYIAYGGSTYGSVTAPIDLGSGGGGYSPYALGGVGGGTVRLTVSGTLQVDGRISARGNAPSLPSAGGGAGGSINLTVGTLAGSGIISANGGAGNGRGGGGGGGRIAISYSSANTFSGLMSAYGGAGAAVGGAGTIYLKPASVQQGPTLLVLDNGGQAGTNTSWPLGATFDVTLRNGASLAMATSSQTIPGNLVIGSNGWIYVSGTAGINPGTFYVNGNATIQAGGGIIADGGGYSALNGGTGPGAGGLVQSSNGYLSGGGGYCGFGAASGGSPAAAGGRACSILEAGAGAGSQGGSYGTYFLGGAGGGAISLNVTGTLQVDGRISSAGGAGPSGNAGGGSGGGIALAVGTLAGSGVIAANGGGGNGLGGGGGGGKIAITYNACAFSGVMSAYGGGGYAWGGAGVIYTKANSGRYAQVLADNGGHAGANTSWYQGSTLDLTVTGGAVVSPQYAQPFGNLLITSNAWLSVSNQVLTVISNATVQAGGGIIADASGYGGNAGPGAGRNANFSPYGNLGGGGGYGGYGAGAGGNSVAYGGATYGSVTAPVDFGSGGGSFNNANEPAGVGGGALRLTVTGALQVNGRISANGGAGVGQGAGGGSGGSVWLTAGTLIGAGTISANGGAGNGWGGGGAGGRVCVQYGANAFAGAYSASSGGGYAWGGAGTIYTKANSATIGQLLVDNGGHSGYSTPIPYSAPFDLTVRGAAIAYPSTSYLLLSNLFISGGGTFTCIATHTNLDVEVLGNATIDADGQMAVDGKGFSAGGGPGAGVAVNLVGSGAGYGGNGGASSAAPGGAAYGSAQQPVDRGSSGGWGWGTALAGSEGGGAIRLTIGGALTLNGRLSAGGNAGLQDDSGGGSGGSIWLTAGALAGMGTIAADGGVGELYNGGGGGGGRIAIYSPVEIFAGLVSVAGGAGLAPGQPGSVYYDSFPPVPQVVSITPVGIYTSAVSSAVITFDAPVNPYSVGAPGVLLATPRGVIVSNITSSPLSPYRFQLGFPAQAAQGTYTLMVGPPVRDLYGQPLSQVYTGTFSIAWMSVQGSITDTNGQPVPNVIVQSDQGWSTSSTDSNGNYVVSVPPVGVVNVRPSKSGLMFVPASRAFTDVTTPITNQNYLAVTTVVPALTAQRQTTNYVLSWYGIPGVTYQPLYSTNLVDWLPYDGVLPGTNGPLQLVLPIGPDRMKYFRLGASY